MKKATKLISLLLAMMMLFSLAACGGGGGGQESQTPAGSTEPAPSTEPSGGGTTEVTPKTIGYVTISGSAPWGALIGTTLQGLCEESGWTFRYLDAETNADKLNEHVQTMIDAGVEALVIFGGDRTANVDNAKKAHDAGIPVFMAALDVAEGGQEYVAACVGPDQQKAFEEIGQYVIEDNEGAESGKLVVQISGVPFLDDYIQREAGFMIAMEGTNYDVKEAQYAYSDRSQAKTYMEQYIQTYGEDIDILIGYDDDLTMGAVQAIDEAGMTGQIKVYSFTGQNDAIQAVKDGKMELTVMNRAGDIAQELMNTMVEYFSTGETEYYHYTDLTYITADNVDEYVGQGEF